MRLAAVLPLLLAPACVPIGVLAHPEPDSGTPEGDTDSDADGDTDTDTDADTDADTEPVADFTVWEGTRTFSYDWAGGCEESVSESGDAILEGDWAYDDLVDLCPGCDWFYELSVSPDEVCNWISIATETYRGLELGEDSATVWRLDDGEGEHLAEGSFDGWTIAYNYELDHGIQVAGQVTFQAAE